MSKTIDERVVSMQFDNKHFEHNVKTTMSTLDKLKAKLSFKGATKGLEEINYISNKIDICGLSNGIDGLNKKFSVLRMAGVLAFSNIANSALIVGKNIVSALTIKPVTTGFNEYELKMGSVQTIMASTGETLETVNRYLEELNEYSDQTIYSFSDMTQNIGKFTNAGVKLEDAVMAIKGISNEAAISGANANEASRAMYNFAQALSAGYVKLMDWKSIENANMATVEFKNQLIETAVATGTLTKQADGMYVTLSGKTLNATRNFNESLNEQWMTTDVLVNTLKKYADETTEIGGKAKEAATKVKTFTQLFDTLKESAQSGWAQSWEIIVGDFNEASELLTRLSEGIGGFISKTADLRNNSLIESLGTPWERLAKRLKAAGIETKKFQDALKKTVKEEKIIVKTLDGHEMALDDLIEKEGSFEKTLKHGWLTKDLIIKTLERFSKESQNVSESTEEMNVKLNKFKKVVADVWFGKYGNHVDRIKALAEAGYEYSEVQELVNKTVNDHKLDLEDLTEAQAESLGFTKEETKALASLAKQAKETGTPLNKLLDDMAKPSGRELLIETFFNIVKAIQKPLDAIGKAWRNIFPKDDSDGLYGLIEKLNKFSEALIISDEAAENFQKIFEGVFAGLQAASWFITGSLTTGLKILKAVLGLFGMTLMDVVGIIADYIIKFRDWVKENTIFIGMVDKISAIIYEFAKGLHSCIQAFLKLKPVQDIIDRISDSFKSLFGILDGSLGGSFIDNLAKNIAKAFEDAKKWIENLGSAKWFQIGIDIVNGLIDGIEAGVEAVITTIVNLAKDIITSFMNILDEHSPSKVFFKIGLYILIGLLLGLEEGRNAVIDAFKDLATGLIDIFKNIKIGGALKVVVDQIVKIFRGLFEYFTDEGGNIEWGKIFALGSIVGFLVILNKIRKVLETIANPLESLSGMLDSVGGAFKQLEKTIKAYSYDIKAKAIQKLAISIGILAASVYALATVEDTGKLWNAVGVIGVLSAILVGLALAVSKINDASIKLNKEGLSVSGITTGLVHIGLSLLALAAVVHIIGSMDAEQVKQGGMALVSLAVGLSAFVGTMAIISRFSKDIKGIGKMMLKMSISMLIMIGVMKIVSKMDPEDILIGLATMEGFILLIGQIALANRLAGNNNKLGSSMLGIASVMFIMSGILKMVSKMDPGDILIGLAVMETFVIFVMQMGIAMRVSKKQFTVNEGIFGSLMGMASALLVMTFVLSILSKMNPGDVIKGIIIMQGFIALIAEMLLVARLSKKVEKFGWTLLSMASSMLILAGVALIVSMIDIGDLAKGITAIGLMSAMMAMMIKATQNATDVSKSIKNMAIAIGVIAGSIIILSLLDPKDLVGPTLALSMLMGMFGLMTKMSSNVKSSIPSLIGMVAVTALLSGLIFALSKLDVGSTIETAGSISLLMLTLSGSMSLIKNVGDKAIKAIVPLAALTLIASMVGLLLVGLSKCNPGHTVEIASSISMLLIAMSSAALILSKVGPLATIAAAGAAALMKIVLIVSGILVTIGGLIGSIPKAKEFLEKGIPIMSAIGRSLGALIGGIIGGIGEGITSSLPQMGENISNFIKNISDTGSNASKIKPGSFDGIIDLVGALAAIELGNLFSKFASIFGEGSSMVDFVKNAKVFILGMADISLLLSKVNIDNEKMSSLAELGEAFSKLTNSLPRTGGIIQDIIGEKDLAGFGDKVAAFCTTMLDINETINSLIANNSKWELNDEIINSIVKMGEAFSKLTNSLPRTGGMIQDIVGEKDLVGFGGKVKAFCETMMEINDAIVETIAGDSDWKLNDEAIISIAKMGKAFSELTKNLPRTGGMLQDIVGEKDLAGFGDKVAAFCTEMKKINEEIGPDFKMDEASINSIILVASKFGELQESLPKSDTWVDKLLGGNDLESFGKTFTTYAKALKDLRIAMGENGFSEDLLASIVSTGTALSTLQENLPEENWFDGKMNLSDFAVRITDFGESLKVLSELDLVNIDGAVIQAEKIKSFINELSDVNYTGLNDFVGTLITKGGIEKVADSIRDFNNKIKDVDTDTMSRSISSAYSIKTLISSLAGIDSSGVENFKAKDIGEAIKGFSESTSTFDPVMATYALASADTIKNFIADLVGLDVSGVAKFKTAISEFSTITLDDLFSVFKDATMKVRSIGSNIVESLIFGMNEKNAQSINSYKNIITSIIKILGSKMSDFVKLGKGLVTNLGKGIDDSKGIPVEKMSSTVSSVRDIVASYYASFEGVGGYLVAGFAAGISANTWMAEAKAAAMAEAAINAARSKLAINSPSKVFRAIGKGVPEGFIQGIGMLGTKVKNAACNMSDRAIDGTQNAIARIANAINTDIDAQPTIRPVLDLSDVTAGAGAINGMFDMNPTIGAISNARVINSMMNKNQNRSNNDDVVSAIKELAKDMGGSSGDTYNINGVTYDDGSNISDAIKTIVRAAKVERRT